MSDVVTMDYMDGYAAGLHKKGFTGLRSDEWLRGYQAGAQHAASLKDR